jgi:PTS system mannose-specific IIB component/fructoselysine and glucoselysine-specific PTS system IIB component
MSVALYRIDDRLIHGQVVVGWGQPLDIGFIVLVDDNVATCDWEQDLYRMGVPPEMEIIFADVTEAIRRHPSFLADPRRGIIVTPDIATMQRFVSGVGNVTEVNVGGIHHRAGRVQKMRYVFLSAAEEAELRELMSGGMKVTAQDVPTARAVPMNEILGAAHSAMGTRD